MRFLEYAVQIFAPRSTFCRNFIRYGRVFLLEHRFYRETRYTLHRIPRAMIRRRFPWLFLAYDMLAIDTFRIGISEKISKSFQETG